MFFGTGDKKKYHVYNYLHVYMRDMMPYYGCELLNYLYRIPDWYLGVP